MASFLVTFIGGDYTTVQGHAHAAELEQRDDVAWVQEIPPAPIDEDLEEQLLLITD